MESFCCPEDDRQSVGSSWSFLEGDKRKTCREKNRCGFEMGILPLEKVCGERMGNIGQCFAEVEALNRLTFWCALN